MDIVLYEEFFKMREKLVDENHYTSSAVFKNKYENNILQILAAGDFYYFVMNVEKGAIDFVYPSIKSVLGVTPEAYDMQRYFGSIHPDDLPYFMNFKNEVIQFVSRLPSEKKMKYKVRYDYRVRKADGDYIRVMHQAIPIQCAADGSVIRTLVVHTDISDLKKENKSTLSFIGLEGEPSYIDVEVNTLFKPTHDIFTQREKQILVLVAEGKNSISISDQLKISKLTVDKHRNNILAKTNSPNISGLVKKGILEGWL